MKVAFFGAGNMGTPMARNLLRAGHQVSVWNRTPEKLRPLAADGARIAASIVDAARGADVAITMLANDEAVRATVFGHDGFVQALPAATIHMCTSTISAELAKHLAQWHAGMRQGYISAPVLGRPEAA